MKAIRIILVLIAIAIVATLVLTLRHSRIDPLVDFRGTRIPINQAAIEREVAESELAEYGAELVPDLRAELRRGIVRRSKFLSWAAPRLPGILRDYIAKREFEQVRRSEKAALTLGRLRQNAISSIGDLQRATSGHIGDSAQVALAMILTNDAQAQSNAIAGLAGSSQPRRAQIAYHAHEIWPDHPEVLDLGLHDVDGTVRAFSLSALCSYGTRASNAVPVLLEMLADPYGSVRPRAALALGLVAPEYGTNAVAVMLEQQRTNSSWTGDYAYVLYQSLGPVASNAVPKLEADLADPAMAMFHGDAAGALWRITGKTTPEIIAGLGTGVRIGVQRTQLRCLRILREIGPPAAAAVPVVNSVKNHPRILVRKLARETLDSINGASGK